MKTIKTTLLYAALIAVVMCACSTNKSVIHIPSNQTVEIDYSQYNVFNAELYNKGVKSVEISVNSKTDGTPLRGFGLGPKGKEEVIVESESKLVIKNTNSSSISIALAVSEVQKKPLKNTSEYRSLTLKNTSSKSIPLIIPSVMNPNLSPFSKSGVELELGQEIFFKNNGRKYVLLTITDRIEQGAEIDIPKLLEKRKEELELK